MKKQRGAETVPLTRSLPLATSPYGRGEIAFAANSKALYRPLAGGKV